jgi:hypothetical protein
VKAWADANPEHNEKAGEADQAKGNTTCFQDAYFPQRRHEGVNSKELARCTSERVRPKDSGRETHEGNQGHPKLTRLPDDALSCAIVPRRHDPAVSPPNIEDPTHGLHKVKPEKRKLSCKIQ